MPEKNPFKFSLKDKDAESFRKAVEKYKKHGVTERDLIRGIICSWLFNNKLQIEEDGRAKRSKK